MVCSENANNKYLSSFCFFESWFVHLVVSPCLPSFVISLILSFLHSFLHNFHPSVLFASLSPSLIHSCLIPVRLPSFLISCPSSLIPPIFLTSIFWHWFVCLFFLMLTPGEAESCLPISRPAGHSKFISIGTDLDPFHVSSNSLAEASEERLCQQMNLYWRDTSVSVLLVSELVRQDPVITNN